MTDSSRTYDVGDQRRLTVQIRGEDEELIDPTNLVFRIREPDDVVTTYQMDIDAEVIRFGVGGYYVHWTCAKPGLHHWRYEATGNVIVAEQSTFAVRAPSA